MRILVAPWFGAANAIRSTEASRVRHAALLAPSRGCPFWSFQNRREFITLLAGTAAWPLLSRAEQAERMRRAIERAVEAFARSANGGLIMTGSATLSAVTRDLIITLASRHKLPAVYAFRFMVTAGGLVSYGPDLIDEFQRAAGYVDRILKGEKLADLPVLAPTKYELVINRYGLN